MNLSLLSQDPACSSGSPLPAAMSSQQQQQQQQLPQKTQQHQVKQPCQPPPVKCQETCAPQTKDPCAPQAKKQCPPKGTAIPAQQKCPMAQQVPQSKQK
ncbi:small proline-rich protein 4 isoform X1 [Myotis myotis]|nr:small proline-rich protein 4 isoform X1 [Myotis myotis]